MAKQKLSPKAAAAKKKRDLAFAKTFARKRKKAGKNIKGKDFDHKTKKFISVKANRGNRGRGTKKEG